MCRKITSWLCIIVMILLSTSYSMPVFAAPSWPAVFNATAMPFRPADKAVCRQNPPDFSWPYISGADTYDLQVSRDSGMTNVTHGTGNLTTNFYNFPYVFESGTWYWRVRFHNADGWSDWSQVRRFRIDTDAWEFPVPSVDVLLGQIQTAHPRVLTNSSNLAEFRSYADGKGKAYYDTSLARAQGLLNEPAPAEPIYTLPPDHPHDAEWVDAQNKLRSEGEGAANDVYDSAVVYLISQDPGIGQKAKELLLNISSWDPYGSTSYRIQDQVHRAIAYRAAIAYDCIYELLSQDEKYTVLNMIKTRTQIMVDDLVNSTSIAEMPYESHGWTAFGMLGVISITTLNEIPEASDWFREIIPVYVNVLPPWGGEDGGWSQGTNYWGVSTFSNNDLIDALLSATNFNFNLYDKAFEHNSGLYPLYMMPNGTPTGGFGDDADMLPAVEQRVIYSREAEMYKDEIMQWAWKSCPPGTLSSIYEYYYGDQSITARPPVDYQKARWSEDIGWAAMHSSLYDPDRVSLLFKSSPYGSYNHSHADQNGFIINAFGETLALDSGYYDWYFSTHDYDYAKRTFAHNAITFDGKKGQPVNDIAAKGQITGFATSPQFDAVSGDAAESYKGGLQRAKRHIIYLRPSMFVVIDDLAAGQGNTSSFEWWLHAKEQLNIDQDQSGATIVNGNASMKARILYPSGITAGSEDKFIGVNGTEVRPQGRYSYKPDQKHAWFSTPAASETTIVTTLNPYRTGTQPQNVTSSNGSNYIKLAFEDNTQVIVRLTASGEVNAGEVIFNGSAAVIKGNDVMLVSGTSLSCNSTTLISSTSPVTAAVTGGRISISCQDDSTVQIYSPGTTKLEDYKNRNIPSSTSPDFIPDLMETSWAMNGNYITLNMEPGQHHFILNNSWKPQNLPNVQFEVDDGTTATPMALQSGRNVDSTKATKDSVSNQPGLLKKMEETGGTTNSVTLQARRNIDGTTTAWGNLTNQPGLHYITDMPDGLIFDSDRKSNIMWLPENASIILDGTGGTLRYSKVGTMTATQADATADYAAMLHRTEVWTEAEHFSKSGSGTFNVYTTRAFLSSGTGVGTWDNRGQWLKYIYDVPAAGEYDIAIKYVGGWSQTDTDFLDIGRYINLGGSLYYTSIPHTTQGLYGSQPEHWNAVRIMTVKTLNPGPVELTIWNDSRSMNIDWIGLVKRRTEEEPPTKPTNLRVVSSMDNEIKIAWDASSDNVGIYEYDIYKDGLKAGTVSGTDCGYTVQGLATGTQYTFYVVARDQAGNDSGPSEQLLASTTDTIAPAWQNVSITAPIIVTDSARLQWSGAADNSQVSSYEVYRVEGSTATLTGTSNICFYDVSGLQAGTSCTFKVEAVDGNGNKSTDGPSITVITPSTSTGEFLDTFDDEITGTKANGDGWAFTADSGLTPTATVEEVPSAANKSMMLLDSDYDTASEYRTAINATKTFQAVAGNTAFETRFRYGRVNHENGNYAFTLKGGGKVIAKIAGFSGGYFGYFTGSSTYKWLPATSANYKLPADTWFTFRIEISPATKTYNLIVTSDAFKSYNGAVDSPGVIDKAAGTLTLANQPFVDSTAGSIDSVQLVATKYTGKYYFDYVTVYERK